VTWAVRIVLEVSRGVGDVWLNGGELLQTVAGLQLGEQVLVVLEGFAQSALHLIELGLGVGVITGGVGVSGFTGGGSDLVEGHQSDTGDGDIDPGGSDFAGGSGDEANATCGTGIAGEGDGVPELVGRIELVHFAKSLACALVFVLVGAAT